MKLKSLGVPGGVARGRLEELVQEAFGQNLRFGKDLKPQLLQHSSLNSS